MNHIQVATAINSLPKPAGFDCAVVYQHHYVLTSCDGKSPVVLPTPKIIKTLFKHRINHQMWNRAVPYLHYYTKFSKKLQAYIVAF